MRIQPYLDYARVVILNHLRELIRHRRGVITTKRTEHLHQLRVTARRLRNDLSVFRKLFPKKKSKIWKAILRNVTRSAGIGRDLDVRILFLERLAHRTKNAPLKSGLWKLRDYFQAQRLKRQPAIVKVLNDAQLSKVLIELEEFLKKGLVRGVPSGENVVSQIAEAKIRKRLKKLLKFRRYVGKPECTQELHQMRIAAKHLRYTLETFEGFYGRLSKKYINSVLKVQGDLGDIHDFYVWRIFLEEIKLSKGRDADFQKAVLFFRKRCAALEHLAYKKFVRSWENRERRGLWKQLREFIKMKK